MSASSLTTGNDPLPTDPSSSVPPPGPTTCPGAITPSAETTPQFRWLDWFLVESQSKLTAFQPKELSNTLWALATLGHRPTKEWMQQLLASCSARLADFQPQEMTNVAWSLAQLNYHPGDTWIASFLAASYPLLFEFESGDQARVACALAKLSAAPSAGWIERLAAAVQAKFSGLDAAEAMATVAALRRLSAAAVEEEDAAAVFGLRASTLVVRDASLVVRGSSWEPDGTGVTPWSLDSIEPAATAAAAAAGQPSTRAAAAVAAQGLQQRFDRSNTGRNVQQAPASLSWLESFVAEVQGMAALVSLMPDLMQQRLRQWPRAWAAQRLMVGGTGGGGRPLVVAASQKRRQQQQQRRLTDH